MSEFRGVIRSQVEALFGELRQQQEARCQELLRTATSQARELLRTSRRQLRERGRLALAAERKRRAAALQRARNRMRVQESQRVQLLYAEFLRQAWPQLIAELQERWTHEASRREWCEMLLDEASRTLETSTWTITHARQWTAQDARWLGDAMRKRGLSEASLNDDGEIHAGLKITSGSACVDGTIDGLLARAGRIEGRLLAAWISDAQQTGRGQHD